MNRQPVPYEDRLRRAFELHDRTGFVLDEQQKFANFDVPLSIGYGQTISQPSTVAMMLRWLQVEPGQKILDVGSGSGWTAALLSYLVGPKGYVYAVEKQPALVEFGQLNCKKSGVKNAKFFMTGKTPGLPKYAPFDRILVSAAAKGSVPAELKDQLKVGGILVIPVDSEIRVLEKIAGNKFIVKIHSGFAFVPLL